MPFDPQSIDLAQYPFEGSYDHPSYGDLAEKLAAQLALPKGVSLSDAPKGASWASWAVPPGGTLPEKRSLAVRLRVLGIVPHKKLGEALAVSYVALDGTTVVAGSEDHAFKPPRPAALAFVGADGSPIEITAAIRDAIAKVAAPTKKAGKEKPAAKKSAPTQKPTQKPAQNAASTAFVIDTPISQVVALGATIVTAHQGPSVHVWSAEGRLEHKLAAGGAGMIPVRAPALSPDGRRIATGASDVRIFDRATGEELLRHELPKKSSVESLSWSHHGLLVSVLAPKDLVLLRFDEAGKEMRSEHRFTRAPGMVGEPLFDADRVHFVREQDLAWLDLSSGKLTDVPLKGAGLEPPLHTAGLTTEGLWVSGYQKYALLDGESYRVLRTVAPGKVSSACFAADGSGWAVSLAGPDGEEVAWLAPDGKVRARWKLPAITGLDSHLAALKDAGKSKDSRRYLDYTDGDVVGLAFTTDDIVVATPWTLGVFGRDGSPKARTTF